jgi:uncharacterized protein
MKPNAKTRAGYDRNDDLQLALKTALRVLREATPARRRLALRAAARMFGDVDPRLLAQADQALFAAGLGPDDTRRLCDLHRQIARDIRRRAGAAARLAESHPVAIAMDEHKIILRNLARLERIAQRLRGCAAFHTARRELNALKELAHFFLETEKHHQREEEALFPYLELHGVTALPRRLREEHVTFLARKRAFRELMDRGPEANPAAFRKDFARTTGFLLERLGTHIYIEDRVVYPTALLLLSEAEWQAVRRKFDAIGYCCFAPADLPAQQRVVA